MYPTLIIFDLGISQEICDGQELHYATALRGGRGGIGEQHSRRTPTNLAIDEEEALPRLLEGDVGEAVAPAEARWRHDWLAICTDPVIVARRRVRAPKPALSAVLHMGRNTSRGGKERFLCEWGRGCAWWTGARQSTRRDRLHSA